MLRKSLLSRVSRLPSLRPKTGLQKPHYQFYYSKQFFNAEDEKIAPSVERTIEPSEIKRSDCLNLQEEASVRSADHQGQQQEILVEQETTAESENDSIPWYMRETEDDTFIPKIQEDFQIPELPGGSPESLQNIIDYMGNQLSLGCVKVIDMSKVDNSAATNFSKYMVLCDGKSSKHVMKAAILLYKYLKDQYKIVPSMEGLTHLTTKKMNKRMKKNVGKKAQSAVNGYYGEAASIPNSWIMIDSLVDGIYINLLTSERRKELNLEYLWASKEERARINEEKRKLRESKANESNYNSDISDDIFKGIRYYHTSRNIQSKDIQLLELEKLPQSQLREIFAVTANNNNTTSNKLNSFLSKVPLISNQSGKNILKKYQDLFACIDGSNFDEVYDFAEFLVYHKLAEPIILNQILKANGEPLTQQHISKLFTSLNYSIIQDLSVSEAEQYLESIWDIFESFSLQGNHKLDLSDLETQNNLLKLAKIVFKVPQEVTNAVESIIVNPRIHPEQITDIVQLNASTIFNYNKRGTLIHLISEKFDSTYSFINNEQDFKNFILFKNEFLMSALNFYAHHADWVKFWNLWKDESFTFAMSDSLVIQKYDSRPWFSFLCLCYATKRTTTMSHALNYWNVYYRQNSIDLEANTNLKIIIEKISTKLNISTL